MRIIAKELLHHAERFLRERGAEGLEAVVLVAGRPTAAGEILDTLIVPRQIAEASYFGCSVEIPAAEVASISSQLRSADRRLYVKIHTHPGRAYHSDLDRANMLMQFDRGVSIVVPNFCRGPIMNFPGCDFVMYDAKRWDWVDITPDRARHFALGEAEVSIIDRR